MNWNKRFRQVHRLLAVVFTVTVIVTFVALTQEEPPIWVFYLPLPPLALLMVAGLYLLVLPYATKWRSGRRTAPRNDLMETR